MAGRAGVLSSVAFTKPDVDARDKPRGMATDASCSKKKCEATMAVEALDPGAPTKVGGHHVTGSTDPVRDSSLKDR
jgi:hypothetical protein